MVDISVNGRSPFQRLSIIRSPACQAAGIPPRIAPCLHADDEVEATLRNWIADPCRHYRSNTGPSMDESNISCTRLFS